MKIIHTDNDAYVQLLLAVCIRPTIQIWQVAIKYEGMAWIKTYSAIQM